MSEDIVVVLDALGEDDFYYRPATTKATIDKAASKLLWGIGVKPNQRRAPS